MKREYTEAIHAKKLIIILEKENTCMYCPAAPHTGADSVLYRKDYDSSPCKICYNFINISGVDYWKHKCPCSIFGEQKAIKRSWTALEEKGYI